MSMQITAAQPEQTKKPRGNGCLSELTWLAAGFVLPIVSPAFYRKSARRPAGMAVLFFLVFQSLIALLLTARIGISLFNITTDINSAFEEEKVPSLTIHAGIASADGPQPAVLFDGEGTFLAVDTTGRLTEIDRKKYARGFLLTRTSLHVLSQQGGYQMMPLVELNKMTKMDPILIDSQTCVQYWKSFSAVAALASLLGAWLWLAGGWFVWLSFLSVVFWGLVSLMRPKPDFGMVLSAGIYAFVPATYAHYLLTLVGIQFCALHNLLLGTIWLAALLCVLALPANKVTEPAMGLRSWKVLAGLPLLLGFAVNLILHWDKAPWVLWPLAFVTFLVLAAAELWPLIEQKNSEPGSLPDVD